MEKTCFNCGTPITKEYCEDWPNVCEHWMQKKPQTNADRIRAMSDEELAEFLANEISHGDCFDCELECATFGGDKFANSCCNAHYRFLKQPVKDGEG